MCMTCGCGNGEVHVEGAGPVHTHADGTTHSHLHEHGHEHGHEHPHEHPHDHPHAHGAGSLHYGTGTAGASRPSAVSTIAASRWQPLPVLICSAGAPVARMRSASNVVC